MNKLLVVAVLLAVGAFFVLKGANEEPDSVREAMDKGLARVKQSEDLSALEEVRLRVQLSLTDYNVRNGTYPTSLAQLVPVYFDAVPVNPETKKELAYKKVGTSFELGSDIGSTNAPAELITDADFEDESGLLAGVDLGSDFVNPNTMKKVAFVYDVGDKRDPFQPFSAQDNIPDNDCGPLGTYDLGQLKVMGVVADNKGSYVAMIEDGSGKGYTVRPGTKMGKGCSEVISIEEDRLKLLRRDFDFTGKLSETPVEMRIQSGSN